MIPLCENNYNCCELGPRSTGKSHLYKEVSPNSILISGGKTTVANLFYNMASRRIGLVGLFDVVAFDEVAGINFQDKDGIQIMKDYSGESINSGKYFDEKIENHHIFPQQWCKSQGIPRTRYNSIVNKTPLTLKTKFFTNPSGVKIPGGLTKNPKLFMQYGARTALLCFRRVQILSLITSI